MIFLFLYLGCLLNDSPELIMDVTASLNLFVMKLYKIIYIFDTRNKQCPGQLIGVLDVWFPWFPSLVSSDQPASSHSNHGWPSWRQVV